jgi:hypothetical protein
MLGCPHRPALGFRTRLNLPSRCDASVCRYLKLTVCDTCRHPRFITAISFWRATDVYSSRHLLCVTCFLIGEATMLSCSYGQSASSPINGTITDQSAAQVPDARIFFRDIDTGIWRITTADRSRRYPWGGPQEDSLRRPEVSPIRDESSQ